MLSEVIEELLAPFPPHRVSWRVGSRNAEKTAGRVLAYIDARDVMERLDEIVGAENWSDDYEETPTGRIICGLTIYGVRKCDGAGDTGIEGAKGAISDAFKRAAVKFGIGRYLYGLKSPWVDLVNGKLPDTFDGNKYLPAPNAFASKQAKTKYWKAMRDAASESDGLKAKEHWSELTTEQKSEIWNDLSSGIRSTLKELLKEE